MDYDHIDTSNEMVKKIIRTSFMVFSQNDMKKASTNMIVQKAGISRGILYHYFKNKEELFDYLNYYSFQRSFEEVNQYIDWDNRDLIKRICDITKYRLDSIAEYPYMIEFNEKYKDQVIRFTDIKVLREWREKFHKHNIDYSLFKENLDMEKVLHILKWTFRGLYKELLNKPEKSITEEQILQLKEDCSKYYEILATTFYRQGEKDDLSI